MVARKPLNNRNFVKQVMPSSRGKFWGALNDEVLDSVGGSIRLDHFLEGFHLFAYRKLRHLDFSE
jgi:hypothetical protein